MKLVQCVADSGAILGEGSLWDAGRRVLWWVDIKGQQIHRFDPASGEDAAIPAGRRLTALALTRDGRLLGCGDGGFGFIDPGNGAFSPWMDVAGEPAGNRFNDGKVDPDGQFWASTMDDAENAASGALYRLDPTGQVARVADGFRVANGPAFDSLGRMYLSDSSLRIIYRYPADAHGDASARQVFMTFREEQGYPDGMTCDGEDHVWAAFWDGWCVRRLAPGGGIVAELPLPVQRPTSCAFGGEALDTLYVTSATVGLNRLALSRQRQAGGLFALRPGVTGVAPHLFGRPPEKTKTPLGFPRRRPCVRP